MSKEMQNYIEKIKSTGFVLEFEISEILRKSDWNIINSRYYIDDPQNSVREIDIVAYQIHKLEDFWVITSLIVSCKKDEKNLWAFLSKDSDSNNVNIERNPVHIWTNHKVLDYIISEDNFKDDYYKYITNFNEISSFNDWTNSEFDIFAFQLMDKSQGTAQNDKPIFESIASLVKAQAYEIKRLNSERKSANKKFIYQFNLISVVESDFIRLYFKDNNITATQIEQENHIFRYIIDRKQIFARVHFVTSSCFEQILTQYNILHQVNCSYFQERYNDFHENLLTDYKRISVFKNDAEKYILQVLKAWEVYYDFIEDVKMVQLDIVTLRDQEGNEVLVLAVFLPISNEYTNVLNTDKNLKSKIKNILIKYYKNINDFIFDGMEDF